MPQRPNIILILADQFRGDCLGVMGNHYIQTPYLDELAGRGMLFERAYSPSPTCVPARACLVTGNMPAKTGFFTNDFSVPWPYRHTLMEQLRDGGYQTINVGKNHFSPKRAGLGFEVNRLYETKPDEQNYPTDYHLWLERETNGQIQDTALYQNCNNYVVTPWTHDSHLHPTEWTVDESIRQLLRRDPSRPFYLQVSFQRPHSPLDPPLDILRRYDSAGLPEPATGDWAAVPEEESLNTGPFEGRFSRKFTQDARRGYYASITHIDQQIGKLMTFLQTSRLLPNTWVLFTSDHGDLLGDHFQWRKGPAMEGSSHIPLILCPPQSWKPGKMRRCKIPVNLCDILPTFLDAAGITPAYEPDGKSLLPLLREDAVWERRYIYGENHRRMPALGIEAAWSFVTDGRYKFLWDSVHGRELFFDLETDPLECHDLSHDPAYTALLKAQRDFLIGELKKRPQDDLVDENGCLKWPRCLPPYRESTTSN